MAFSTTNVMRGNLGSMNSVSGGWTGTVGDAAGSLVIGSANVIQYDFDSGLSSGGPSEKPFVSASVASGQTTLSIYYKQTVTAGKFRVVFE